MNSDKVKVEMDKAEIFALQEFIDYKNIDKFISKVSEQNSSEIASNALQEICQEFFN